MFYRLRTRLARARFDAGVRGVLDTPPLAMREAEVTVVSQLRSPDLLAWLVAIKSTYPRLPGGDVVVVDDGSLTPDDREVIARHVPGARIAPLAEGQLDSLPRGGTWERLCVIGQACRERYTIQLDADVVTLGPLDAVAARIEANVPFALADAPVPGLCGVREAAAWNAAREAREDHVQNEAEIAFARAALPAGARYLRGTSAFAGFPRGADILPGLRAFSDAMREALGERWDEWGTEQVASNYAVANAGDAVPLVPPEYVNHTPEAALNGAQLVHFYGTHRFQGGRYLAAARRAVAEMG